MFYQTRISKIYDGGAVDSHNKFLKFIGRLPVQVGDYVWTDGNFIFGHVPFREEPNIPNLQGGIPAAFSDSKGYFSTTGSFKNYPITVDNATPHWIVNGKRKYFHSSDRVFDAEISINENGVEDGLFTAELDGINGGNGGLYFVQDDTVLDDDAVVIKKDGKEISRVYLHDVAEAFTKLNDIRNDKYPCDGLSHLIGHAQLLNFHLNQKGGWDAIIASSVHAVLKYSSVGYDSLHSYNIARIPLGRKGGYFGYIANQNDEPEVVSATYNSYLAEKGCTFRAEDFIPLDDAPTMEQWFSKPPDKPRGYGNFSTTVSHASPIVLTTPSYVQTFSRNIQIQYLVHLNSNNYKKILGEEITDSGVKVNRYSCTLHDHPYMPNKPIDTTYDGVTVHYYDVGTFLLSEGLGPIWEWISPDTKTVEVRVSEEIVFRASNESVKNIKPFWQYPIQDGFFITMNQWRILDILNSDGQSIVANIAQNPTEISPTVIDLSAGFPTDQVFIRYQDNYVWRQIVLRQEGKDDRTKIEYNSLSILYINGLSGFYRNSSDGRTFSPLPYTQLISRYIVNCNAAFPFLGDAKRYYKLPYILLPAVVKLSNGYLIGIPQHGIYKVDADGVAELISDKDELANLRLRYIPNLSKTRR